ncbi:MAG: bis(5'-nucleosyl)-tetraphosphatase (symmetrical) YqeK [Streptococcaceae bacterium]|jgi:predicted HD superfamily hydrolase involved in NAD metabolism|nr:bis(5'-nucleosyl)-tetraphosphatase (symmetrical) YqeK [Streptococcaceae bacterium]
MLKIDDVLLKKVRAVMSQKRFGHCVRVSEAARALATRYDYADTEKAALAGLLHDYAKEVSDADFIRLIETYQLDAALKNWGNAVWHGKVGFLKVREDLGVEDAAVLRAIQVHTVGAREMSLLDKIIYVADYIEDGRDFPGVDEARELAKVSLDKAVAYETRETVKYLAARNLQIYPDTLATYNSYIGELTK